jgi:phage/plasmid-associated DNA primase
MTQKIFLFEGEGNSGKSTLAEIIGAIVGEQNCTELRTKQLNNRFEMYRFLHRSLLVGSDVDYDFLLDDGAAQLKKLTGGDLISAEKKNGNDTFEFRGDFNILVTTNSRLVLRLYSDFAAWKRRLVLIAFPASGRDPWQNKPEYAKQLIAREGSGILNWAVEGARKLLGDFQEGRGFVLTPLQQNRVDDRINEFDSLCVFLRESIEGKQESNLAT